MKKHFVLASLIVASVFSLCQAEVQYEITDVNTLGGDESRAYGINDSGQVVGESKYSDDWYTHAFLYENGVMTDIGKDVGHMSTAHAINNNGQIVGLSSFGFTPNSPQRAFLYDYDDTNNVWVTRDLGTIDGGYRSAAYAINNNGQVVGTSLLPDARTWHAFICAGTAPLTDLGIVGGASSINDNGLIVGTSANGPYLHDVTTNTITMLGNLGGGYCWANAINNSGLIVGMSYTDIVYVHHAYLYDSTLPDPLTSLGTLRNDDSGRSAAYAINNSGQIVGKSQDAAFIYHAFLYDDRGMVDLNDLIAPDSGWVLTDARDINSSGQIVGYGYNGAGEKHAYLLTPIVTKPVPEVIVNISPDTLNLTSQGQWITVYITLLPPYDVVSNPIDVSSVKITGVLDENIDVIGIAVTAEGEVVLPQVGDYDDDGIPDLAVKFDRQEVQSNLLTGDMAITIVCTVDIGDGDIAVCSDTDTIRVINRGKKK